MKPRRLILILLLILFGSGFFTALAGPPQLPHKIYGQVRIDGALLSSGSQVRAMINGTAVLTTSIVDYAPDFNGAINVFVPGDDASATPQVEGGVNGDTLSFYYPGYELTPNTRFESGKVQRLDLSNGPITYTYSGEITQTAVTLTGNSGPSLIIKSGSLDGDLGPTSIEIKANQLCTHADPDTVRRCFKIVPANNPLPLPGASITFFFFSSQLDGSDCNTIEVYHWNGSAWDALPLTRDDTYATNGRLCSGEEPFSIRVKNVTQFSPFLLKSSEPTALTLIAFGVRRGHSLPAAALLLGLSLGLVYLGVHKLGEKITS